MTDNNRVVAIVIYAIAASTDWMDGQIARMTKTVSWLGKVMDPICDRALLFTGVLGLVVRGELPIWVCVLIIGRDIYLASARSSCATITAVPSTWCFPARLPRRCS